MPDPTPLHPSGRHYGTLGRQWQADQIARADGRPPHAAPTYDWRKMPPADRLLWRATMWITLVAAVFWIMTAVAFRGAVEEMRARAVAVEAGE